MTPATDSTRIWFWFAISSIACLAVLAISPVKDYFREYRAYQNAYKQRLLASAGSSKELKQARAESISVRQVWLPELDRVDRCISCHLGVSNARMATAPEPYRFHPMTPHSNEFDRFGCVTCHRGQGRATTAEDAHGEVADWRSPILPLRYTEASCGVCHEGEAVPEARLLTEGRKLMRRAGCVGCHELAEERHWESEAPRLDGLAQKTTPEWLEAWLLAPRRIMPGTLMPDFHLTPEEARALVAYLWVQPPLESIDLGSSIGVGDATRGKKLFREARCISCHTVEGRGNGSATELARVGSKIPRVWLVSFLANPHAFQPETKMPRYNFSRGDLIDLTQYMSDEFSDPELPLAEPKVFRPSIKLVETGEALYQQYGCSGCHRIEARKTRVRIGPELTGIGDKPAALLDFGRRDDLARSLPAWLAAKINSPRSFRADLKMPDFGFTKEQTEMLVVALLSYSGEKIPESLRVAAATPHYSPPGRFGELMRTYRCLSCHQVSGVGGDISTAPLTAEGSKVQRDWLKQYLLLPTTIRPLLTDRMIPVGMSEEEADFIATFIENVYVDDSVPDEIFPDGIPAARL
ncbi:MAG TPA: c-type cytochrome, partial [Thermoanaerobaculia bacterium]